MKAIIYRHHMRERAAKRRNIVAMRRVALMTLTVVTTTLFCRASYNVVSMVRNSGDVTLSPPSGYQVIIEGRTIYDDSLWEFAENVREEAENSRVIDCTADMVATISKINHITYLDRDLIRKGTRLAVPVFKRIEE